MTWDSNHDQDQPCSNPECCGASYYRHFDSYDSMAPVGCKYCQCEVFVEVDGSRVEEEPLARQLRLASQGLENPEEFELVRLLLELQAFREAKAKP